MISKRQLLHSWVRPLHPGREVTSMLEAERLFKAAGNQVREAKGLEPADMAGQAAG